MTCGIYKIENQINHHCYIGQSVNIERRWQAEKRRAFDVMATDYNYPILRALRKYGVENFTFTVIEECSPDDLNEREKFWIAYYDSFFNGYNQTLGGNQTKTAKKDTVLKVFNMLETTDLKHAEIAQECGVSTEMVQGINTGRYWFRPGIDYPIQERTKNRQIGRKKCYCINCGKEVSQKATYCVECAKLHARKTERPSREELKKLIRTMPFTRIAKIYNVSDNAIRKWCDSYELPRKVSDIKQYSDIEWEEI